METPSTPQISGPNREFAELLRASGYTQVQAADYLARRLSDRIDNTKVSRWASGKTRVPADVLDAMRELSAQPVGAPHAAPELTESADVVPLFGYANAAGSTLRLNEDQRVGVVPIHPAQRGSRQAFAFIVFGDSISPRLSHGDIGYAIRGKPPLKGKPCLVEMQNGEALVKIFESLDEQTLFLSQLEPRKALTYPLREVRAVHAVVGSTFS
jgi:hypothetical protein